jgi:hypothetical protein
MNQGQRRARWRSRFRQVGGEKAAVGGASPVHVSVGSTPWPAQPRQLGSVQLRIGELVLRGFGRGTERSIAKGLERELGRLFSARGIPDFWMNTRSLEGATANRINMRAGENGHSIGERLAHALYEIPNRDTK